MTLPEASTRVTYPVGELLARATVLHVEPLGDGRVAVVTDTTSFHPVDAAWPDQRVLAEVDGFHHHSTAAAFTHDLSRQNALVRLGWRVVRFDWTRVVRRPATVVADLRAVLALPPDSRE